MPRRETIFQVDHFFNIYHRGNNKAEIFFERENYLFFLRQLWKYFPEDVINVHAYCLMPNHFHLLIEIIQSCDFSLMMKNFIISYTKAINKKYGRVGHLFQGQFKSKHIDSEKYLITLSRYIHNNPGHSTLAKKNEEWEFSSYLDYLGMRKEELVVKDFILKNYRSVEDYKEYVESMPDLEFIDIQQSNFRNL